ncbi:putative sugar O-methyltransferase [Pedobacter sp. ISL-68]|uniref:putative sugar O-methyltransferase n=1 Tax=unclassified Pedobacter TaxID=2628915 RepID=UPI001BEA18E1|nr:MULTISPECIES: putative sugar O-methyltransferase [unclassified Pedobacter]MBT2562802.1 putative sugar O-methyltransferase [Pedobacter sp. ISL-64]MBT2593315.1 putative sugar O-methyltransferase [Pedobacter sp. ISL-68]
MKSASDNQRYNDFCKRAATDDAVFSTFRQNEAFQEILEHFSYEDGLTYLNQLKKHAPLLLTGINTFKTNDNFGGADIHYYEEIGNISPSTLHYIRQLAYLENSFGNLDGLHLVEIGGGYGGLAKLVMDRFNIASYTIFDLPEVNLLTTKYLEKFGNQYLDKVIFGNLDEVKNQTYDICVSNCAFTECTPFIQDQYLEKVISRAKSGFMIYNFRVESYHPVVIFNKMEALDLKRMGTLPVEDSNANTFILAWNTQLSLHRLPYRRRFVHKLSPKLYQFGLKIYQGIKNR